MNQLITQNNGGFPLLLNDLRFIDESIRDTFKALLSPYSTSTTTAIILSGCVGAVSGSNTTYSAGYVAIGGEIFKVDQHVAANNTYKHWSIVNSYDPAGLKLFQDGNENDTYLIRKAKVIHSSTLATLQAPYIATNTIHNFIKAGINNTTWLNLVSLTTGSGDALAGTWKIDAKKDVSNFVHLRGLKYLEDILPGGLTDVLIFTLPVGYRPAFEFQFNISQIKGPHEQQAFYNGKVLKNGEVRIYQSSTDFVNIIDVSQIQPFEAV